MRMHVVVKRKGKGAVMVVTQREAQDAREEAQRKYERRLDQNKNARANVAVTKRAVPAF